MSEQPSAAAVAAEENPQPSGLGRALKIAAVLAVVAALVAFGRQAGDYFLDFATWIKSQGALGPVIFIAAYAAGTVAAVPGAVLTLFGGAVFGLVWGTAWVFLGATLGSAVSFLVARYLARGAIERKLAGHGRFAAIDRAVGAQGFRIVFLLRLTPVFPFSLGNYALGLTRVRFTDYLLASCGMLPGTFLYVYYGKTMGDVAALASGAKVGGGPAQQALTVVGLVATIAVTVLITRAARKALLEATETTDDGR